MSGSHDTEGINQKVVKVRQTKIFRLTRATSSLQQCPLAGKRYLQQVEIGSKSAQISHLPLPPP